MSRVRPPRKSGVDPNKRLNSAALGQHDEELWEFVIAIDKYKRDNNRPYPTWSEVFEIIRGLGYRKVK